MPAAHLPSFDLVFEGRVLLAYFVWNRSVQPPFTGYPLLSSIDQPHKYVHATKGKDLKIPRSSKRLSPPYVNEKQASKRLRNDIGRCPVCHIFIFKNLHRHVESHRHVSVCQFWPLGYCKARYPREEGEKSCQHHMYNQHFKPDKDIGKNVPYGQLFDHFGTCVCGWRGFGRDWYTGHVKSKQSPCRYTKALPFPKLYQ